MVLALVNSWFSKIKKAWDIAKHKRREEFISKQAEEQLQGLGEFWGIMVFRDLTLKNNPLFWMRITKPNLNKGGMSLF
ncbi:MAG: hypothetical protein ACEPOZ_11255 [Marinifilaceae bacterium]